VGGSRARLLAFARAATHPQLGTQVWQAALGDHPWRKLYGETDDESVHNPSWRGGPQASVPELLRNTGRAGPRGRGGAARDDAAARAQVAAARRLRSLQHVEAVAEVLAADPGALLTERAARAALASLMAAVRAEAVGFRRTASRDGLACTLVYTGIGAGTLVTPRWKVVLPGRHPVFHLPGKRPNPASLFLLSTVAPAVDGNGSVELVFSPVDADSPLAVSAGAA
jgi:hypothetical protein